MISSPELIIVDVGHGNCAILRDTEAITIIDCPPEAVLFEILKRLKISTIDHVLISHADVDHAGGLADLLEQFSVHNIYINPDADKKSKTWRVMRGALEVAEAVGIQVHIGLTSTLSKKIHSGQVEIEILAPSLGVALGGAGGEDLEGRALSSNAMSAVIGLVHHSLRVALFPGDIDEIGLDNLLWKHQDIRSDILVFPHHGGASGGLNDQAFAQRLCRLVQPRLVVFSLGRERFDNPREEIIQGVIAAVPDAHIMCTQLSRKCAFALPLSDLTHLTDFPAAGKTSASNLCCGGTILIQLKGKQITYAPSLTSHRDFIQSKVLTPLCLQHLSNGTNS